MKDVDVVDMVQKCYKLAFNLSGQTKLEEQSMVACIEDTCETLRTTFKAMTGGEVCTAFRNGSKGLYGEFYGINARTVIDWLRSHRESVAKELISLRGLEEPKKEAKPEEVEFWAAKTRMRLYQAYDDFLKSKEKPEFIDDQGNIIYNLLVNSRWYGDGKRMSALPNVEEVRKRTKKKAIQYLKSQAKAENETKTDIQAALNKIESADEVWKSRAKKFVLAEIFENYKENNITLEDLKTSLGDKGE